MRRLVVSSFVSSLVLGIAGSCVTDDGSVFIQGALPINPANDCKVAAGGADFVFGGTLDVLTPHSFQAALKVVTNLPATFNNTDVTSGDARAPNYPDYGATDNNVIVFDEAEIDYSFVVPVDQIADVNPDAFACDGDGKCASNPNAPTVVQVAGSVFNPQTSLNSASVVLVEAISQTVAAELNTAFENALENPTQRVRVVATVRLKGSTTGNGGLRDISTFPFPFPVDVCRGCLTPNQEFCESVDEEADFVSTPQDTCVVGQDFAQGVCVCGRVVESVFTDTDGDGAADPGETVEVVTNPGSPIDATGCP